MVLPRFIRYPNSPVLTPIINKMVKMMMSHKTFLGMHPPPLNPAHLSRAVDRTPVLLFQYYIHAGASGEKNLPDGDNFLTNAYLLLYMNIMNDEYLQKRLERAARCLKVLAHPIRLMIIHLLGEGELSVQELEKAVGISQSSVSQHLGLLKDKEILESRRVAQQVFYRLRDARLLQLTAITRELFCRME